MHSSIVGREAALVASPYRQVFSLSAPAGLRRSAPSTQHPAPRQPPEEVPRSPDCWPRRTAANDLAIRRALKEASGVGFTEENAGGVGVRFKAASRRLVISNGLKP